MGKKYKKQINIYNLLLGFIVATTIGLVFQKTVGVITLWLAIWILLNQIDKNDKEIYLRAHSRRG